MFYAKDAFEGLDIMEALTSNEAKRDAFIRDTRDRAEAARAKVATASHVPRSGKSAREHLSRVESPKAPFFGVRTIEFVEPKELWPHFDLRSLYRLSWGGANLKGDAWDTMVRDEFEPRLRRYEKQAERQSVLSPRAVYGYFPASGDGDDVIIYDPQDPTREIARFPFSRQSGGEHLCLADYFREPEDGRPTDVVALQVVTVGREVSELTDKLQAAGDYSESYFLHGFSVQSAEALAEHTHARIRRELGIDSGRGKRYSWGYGACPDLSQHAIVWRLLDVENAIDAELTEAFQIIPEQSTAAIVVHHPQASYFNAAAVRELEPA